MQVLLKTTSQICTGGTGKQRNAITIAKPHINRKSHAFCTEMRDMKQTILITFLEDTNYEHE